jgi:hypothetical protein
VNGTGIHLFNGQVTNVLRNARYKADGKIVPMTKGRIQLQSELAEIWFRKPEIRAIREVPKEYRDWVDGPGGGDDGFTPLLGKEGVANAAGIWWTRAKTFKNFVLRGEFQQESGVFVRVPDPDRPGIASVFSLPGNTWQPFQGAGEWNSYEIACVGRTTDVRLNGHLINRIVDNPDRPVEGHVGLGKSHRNVRIKELP